MSSNNYRSLLSLPSPGRRRIAIHVTPAAERALKRLHPWLYENAITDQSGEGQPGDLAVIFDNKDKFLAVGLLDPTSHIRVRVLAHHKPIKIDRDFFKRQLSVAVKTREHLPKNTTGYRLVHGGNDQFPGLVIDRYASTMVIKLYTTAWLPHLADVLDGLLSISSCDRVIIRFSRQVLAFKDLSYKLQDGEVLFGPPITKPILFQENGLWFEADPVNGHKTGFYLDQRENRERISRLSVGKNILNVFAYTGGFTVYSAYGGAKNVTSLDISKPALEVAERNFSRNRERYSTKTCGHETIIGDAFQVLNKIRNQGRKFDLVIIDPPAFAKEKSQVQRAIASYMKLSRHGLHLLRRGGILVQSSCSRQVLPHDFFSAIHKTARNMRRNLKEIKRTGHPIDHPIRFKESAYLKCLFTIAE
jgi:23S rRNA (cytosine1962-C5)-methyltransferase